MLTSQDTGKNLSSQWFQTGRVSEPSTTWKRGPAFLLMVPGTQAQPPKAFLPCSRLMLGPMSTRFYVPNVHCCIYLLSCTIYTHNLEVQPQDKVTHDDSEGWRKGIIELQRNLICMGNHLPSICCLCCSDPHEKHQEVKKSHMRTLSSCGNSI